MKRSILVVFGCVVAVLAVVALGLPFLLETEHRDVDDAFRAKAPGQFVELTHGQVYYQWGENTEGESTEDESTEGENGRVAVLVHGFSTPSFIWSPLFERMAEAGIRVLRYDLYGRGYSDRPDTTYDRKLYEEQLNELLAALDIREPVDLVGLSMGGAVVACFAATYPEKVDRMVFVDPFIGPVDAGPVTLPFVGEYLARVFFAPKLPQRQLRSFYRPEKADPALLDLFTEQMSYRGYRRSLLRSLNQFMSDDLSGAFAEAGRHGKPALLIWGRQDVVVPFAEHERILEPLGAELLAVDDAGHVPYLEQPEIVEPRILEFLASNTDLSTGD